MKTVIQPLQASSEMTHVVPASLTAANTQTKVRIWILVLAILSVGMTLFAPIAMIQGLFLDTPISLLSEYPNDIMPLIVLVLGIFIAISAVDGVITLFSKGYRLCMIISSVLFFISQLSSLIIATNYTEDSVVGIWRELTATITIHPVFILTLLLGLVTMILALTVKGANVSVENPDEAPVNNETTIHPLQVAEEETEIENDYTIPTFVKLVPGLSLAIIILLVLIVTA